MAKEQNSIKERERVDTFEPRKFTVFMHNDDFTTMDFVVMTLMSVFFKTEEEAQQLMWQIHESGKAAVGTYCYDIAVSKAEKATEMARDEGFPLRISVEEQY